MLGTGLVLGALFTASAARADEPSAADLERLAEGYEAVQDWRIDEARAIATDAYARWPEHPMTLALLSVVKLHMSDYAGAKDSLRVAMDGGQLPDLGHHAQLAESSRVVTDGYQEAVSDHFVVRYLPGRDEILVPFAIETLEAAMDRIGGLLGWRPEGRVVVEIYPSAKTLAKVSSLTEQDIENSGTIALCRWNRLMVTTPRAVVFGYSWRDTLAHELAHLIIGGASKNTVPIWLHEGIAKYVETAWRSEPGLGISVDQQERLRKAARKGELIPFEKMHPSMAKLPSQEQTSLAFSEVFTFIEYLVEQKGWSGMRAVLTKMSEGLSDAEAIEAVHGPPLDRLVKRWMKSLPDRPIKRPDRPVKGDRKLVIKDDAGTPDDELHGVSKEGRRYARAADLLYARGRLKAAQKELEKAHAVTQSPLISAKLAMVALANGDLEAAEGAARDAMRGAPNLAGPNVTLAEVLVRVGKAEDARAPLSRAVDINPFDPRIHHLTLAVAGDDDEAARRHAARALALMQGAARSRPPSLGSGGLVRIHGAPFSRVYLRAPGSEAWVATGMLTPTSALALEPGSWELKLLPPSGEATVHTIEVAGTEADGQPQIIIPGATGS